MNRRELREAADDYITGGNLPLAAFYILLVIERTLLKIEHRLETMCRSRATLDLTATRTDKESPPMANRPPITVDPAENDLVFSVTPLAADGAPRSATISWVTTDSRIVSLEVASDTLSAKGRTSGTGTATVTASDGIVTDSLSVLAQAGASVNLGASLIPKGA